MMIVYNAQLRFFAYHLPQIVETWAGRGFHRLSTYHIAYHRLPQIVETRAHIGYKMWSDKKM